jgi:asparagine synthase (glutamine-hydrolysing)
MCGIAGIINFDDRAASREVVAGMARAIAHRGPDGQGAFVDGPIALGHCRLAILDLTEAGAQPMSTDDGRLTITYNGEVYNFRELRGELEALGWKFRSRSDTEVVLKAYAQWGVDCLEKFNGMFALAIWDKSKREMFLARDRYGIKPLYYCQQGKRFLFASEQKALLADPDMRREIDLEALVEYFTFQNYFTDRTLLKGVRLFPPGCWAKLTPASGSELKPVSYWDYHFCEPDKPLARQEYIEEADRLFRQAVKRQLVSDVDVGVYLSGGMDSGSITAIAADELPYIRSFTCGFDLSSASGLEMAYDERRSAEHMSYLFKTEHYEMVLKAGDMERVLPKLAWHLEEPRVGQSYPNYYVAQLASKFVKVVLGGTGGDELFAGYPWRYYRAVVNDDFEHYIDKYYQYWQRLIDNKDIHRVFAPVSDQVKGVWTRDIFRDVFKEHADQLTRPEDYINHSLYFEAKTFLHGLLVVEDKLSMAHSLENRVPFLDNDFVDFAMQVPVSMKLGNLGEVVEQNENESAKESKYFQKTHDGKLLLRQMMSKYIPEKITNGAKQGFSAPDASWFKGESLDYVRSQLYNNNARIYDYMDPSVVQELVDEHLTGKRNRRLLIWSLLNVEQWCEQYLSPGSHNRHGE